MTRGIQVAPVGVVRKVKAVGGGRDNIARRIKIGQIGENWTNTPLRFWPSAAMPELDNNSIGFPKEITLPAGRYQFELWGASGEGANPFNLALGSRRGLGGYVSGELVLDKVTTFWLYQGGSGGLQSSAGGNYLLNGGWNGGGNTSIVINGGWFGGPGGGATDLRIIGGPDVAWNNLASLRSRIIVAGAGGGSDDWSGPGLHRPGQEPTTDNLAGQTNDGTGGNGGGLVGANGYREGSPNAAIPGGSQTSGYAFGIGGPGRDTTMDVGGGGAGYYGGWGGIGTPLTSGGNDGGGGGSSFISGHPGCDAITEAGMHTGQPNHYSGYVFTNTVMQQGVNDGSGKFKITRLGDY